MKPRPRYACAHCKRSFKDSGAHYRGRLILQSLYGSMEVAPELRPATVAKTLLEIEMSSAEELEEGVAFDRSFELCRDCQREFLHWAKEFLDHGLRED